MNNTKHASIKKLIKAKQLASCAAILLLVFSQPASAGVTIIEAAEQLQKELNRCQYALVEFYADWCHVCQEIQRPLEEVSNNAELSSVLFAQVDMEKQKELKEQYQVSAFPTFIFFKQGKQIKEEIGIKNIANFKNDMQKTVQTTFQLAKNKLTKNRKKVLQENKSKYSQKKA